MNVLIDLIMWAKTSIVQASAENYTLPGKMIQCHKFWTFAKPSQSYWIKTLVTIPVYIDYGLTRNKRSYVWVLILSKQFFFFCHGHLHNASWLLLLGRISPFNNIHIFNLFIITSTSRTLWYYKLLRNKMVHATCSGKP